LKRLAIVAGHFPPSNLTAVHRARLWAQHLPEFGWEPVIVTTHWKYYEEILEPELCQLLDPHLEIIHTKALPTKPFRLVGDIGIRSFYWQLTALKTLAARGEIQFVHVTIPSNYSALLGGLLYRKYRIPFGIDYIDPWVVEPDRKTGSYLSKQWLSGKLATWLEPVAVRNASLITGVAPLYYEGVLERNPHLRHQCVTAAMPYGASDKDYDLVAKLSRQPFLFRRGDGLFHMIYAGAMLPNAYAVLERFFQALAMLRDRGAEVMDRLRIHFVGTGRTPTDPKGHNVQPIARRFGLEHWISEYPHRMGYLDVLNHLMHASAVLIIGSTEPHYTPSKIFQAVQAKRPILAVLHENSTAVRVLRESRAGWVVTVTEHRFPEKEELASVLERFVRDPQYSSEEVGWEAFREYSARNSARLLTTAINCAVERSRVRSEQSCA
jgi:hypothetical protein